MAAGGLVAVGLGAWIAVPIFTSSPQGKSGQILNVEGFPSSVTALGDDGRQRILSAELEDATRGFDDLRKGDRLVVTGSGYNSNLGIYVALCKVPDTIEGKPGPCLGGVGQMEEDGEVIADVVEYGASNWINEDWAWRLFGARSFDDPEAGTFSAYIEVPASADENVDCTAVPCGVYTRNDHTALEDRVQDLYLPIAFGG